MYKPELAVEAWAMCVTANNTRGLQHHSVTQHTRLHRIPHPQNTSGRPVATMQYARHTQSTQAHRDPIHPGSVSKRCHKEIKHAGAPHPYPAINSNGPAKRGVVRRSRHRCDDTPSHKLRHYSHEPRGCVTRMLGATARCVTVPLRRHTKHTLGASTGWSAHGHHSIGWHAADVGQTTVRCNEQRHSCKTHFAKYVAPPPPRPPSQVHGCNPPGRNTHTDRRGLDGHIVQNIDMLSCVRIGP